MPLDNAKRRPWTPEEDRRLRELITDAKQTYRSIGRAMGRTESSIENRMQNHGLRLARSFLPKTNEAPEISFFLNGEPLTFAVTDRPCARCAVKESAHHEHGCGQFAADIRVRIR